MDSNETDRAVTRSAAASRYAVAVNLTWPAAALLVGLAALGVLVLAALVLSLVGKP